MAHTGPTSYDLNQNHESMILIRQLEDPDEAVRAAAAAGLAPKARHNPAVTEAMLQRLTDPSGIVRCVAILGLGPLTATRPDVRRRIVAFLDDPNPLLRSVAAAVLEPHYG